MPWGRAEGQLAGDHESEVVGSSPAPTTFDVRRLSTIGTCTDYP